MKLEYLLGEPEIIDSEGEGYVAIVPIVIDEELLFEVWFQQKLLISCRSESLARSIAWSCLVAQ